MVRSFFKKFHPQINWNLGDHPKIGSRSSLHPRCLDMYQWSVQYNVILWWTSIPSRGSHSVICLVAASLLEAKSIYNWCWVVCMGHIAMETRVLKLSSHNCLLFTNQQWLLENLEFVVLMGCQSITPCKGCSTSFQFQFAGLTLSCQVPISILELPSLLVKNTKE